MAAKKKKEKKNQGKRKIIRELKCMTLHSGQIDTWYLMESRGPQHSTQKGSGHPGSQAIAPHDMPGNIEYCIGFTAGCGTASNVVNCGFISLPLRRMNAPLLPIWSQ